MYGSGAGCNSFLERMKLSALPNFYREKATGAACGVEREVVLFRSACGRKSCSSLFRGLEMEADGGALSRFALDGKAPVEARVVRSVRQVQRAAEQSVEVACGF